MWSIRLVGVAIITCLLLTGCLASKPNVPYKITINGGKIYNLIQITNDLMPSHGGIVDDGTYCLPDLNWFQAVFHPSVQDTLSTKMWTEESFDCDDFVVLAKATAIELNWSNGVAALPIGSFSYRKSPVLAHKVVLFLYDSDGEVVVGFYDPTNGGHFIHLDKYEKNNVLHWNI